jgi:PII-like signaling protein
MTNSNPSPARSGIYLKFYVAEGRRHHGMLVYEWLLEKAKSIGVHGGSAFRAVAGFGRHGVLHEQHFFELAGDLPVEVVFVLSEARAAELLQAIADAGLSLFYVRMPVEFGFTNGGGQSE